MSGNKKPKNGNPGKSTSISGSVGPTDPTAHLPEQPSNNSSSNAIEPTRTPSFLPSIPEGGTLRSIVDKGEALLVNVAEATTNKKISKESREIIRTFLDQTSRGHVGALSMVCMGQKCAFISACPLNMAGSELPVSKKCPVEHIIVQSWVDKHLTALGIKDVYSPENSFDMDMLYELAGQQLLLWRCSVHLSDTPDLVSTQLVGATDAGEPLFQDVINPVLDIMDRCGKNVNKLRDALLATRKAQIQAGKDVSDPSKTIAELREKANRKIDARLREERGHAERLLDVDFEIKENDDGKE